jgi:hypothetical protein
MEKLQVRAAGEFRAAAREPLPPNSLREGRTFEAESSIEIQNALKSPSGKGCNYK